MSRTKRHYEEHFDEYTFDELVSWGLTEEEIYIQWESFSKKAWTDWLKGV